MYIKKILWLLALLGLCTFAAIAFYIYKAMFVANTAFNNKEAYIYIPSNANYTDVRAQLQPLLLSIDTFDALAKRKQYSTYVKPGKYIISKGMTNNDIINTLRSKNTPVNVAFNNQHNLQNLAGRISKQIEPDSTAILIAMKDDTFLKQHGFSTTTALAMYLPNSYEFFWNTTPEQFRNKMRDAYKQFWNKSRLNKAKSLQLSPVEVMILASIVYEESKQPKEQPRVAGVYLNRLRIGMRLDADPTIKFAAYQLPEYKNKVIRRVLDKHKTIDSPYNTYKYAGLPPGPIAMPDLSAIDAVLNPEKHNYLYFAADAQRPGFHKFAKNLGQHNANARAYHRYLSKNRIYK